MDFGVGSQASRSGEGHRSTSIPGTGYSATPSVLPPTRSTYPTSPGHTCPRTTPTTSRSRRRAARALRPTVTSSTHGNSNSMFPSRAAPPANGAQHILRPAGSRDPRLGQGQVKPAYARRCSSRLHPAVTVGPTDKRRDQISTTRTSTTVPDRRCMDRRTGPQARNAPVGWAVPGRDQRARPGSPPRRGG